MGKSKYTWLALVLALSMVGTGVAYERVSAEETNDRKPRFTVVARQSNVQFLREAGNQPGPLAPGDSFVVRNDLLQGGKVVGEDHVTCTATFDMKVLCNSTYVLEGQGQLMGQGLVRFGEPEFDIAIVGGTGRFRTARGFVHITVQQTQPRSEELRFQLAAP